MSADTQREAAAAVALALANLSEREGRVVSFADMATTAIAAYDAVLGGHEHELSICKDGETGKPIAYCNKCRRVIGTLADAALGARDVGRERSIDRALEDAVIAAQENDLSVQRCDFEKGWRAGVEWAEEHGESSMVKWFIDHDAAARTPQDVLDSDGEQVRYAETKESK